ncbi:hypothetical protein GXW82_19110 [Streptacidiphilus sp. 4-A2]|nr:hypothetical protein [Streptacidiphilus sp. 4-A2]
MTDWGTVSALATAGGTLVLAAASFASIRSADRAALSAERALQASLRPLLIASRLEAPEQKVMWLDGHWTRLGGSTGYVHQAEDGEIYLAMSIRNAGPGLGVIHGWRIEEVQLNAGAVRPAADSFHRQGRDLYIAPGDTGFWHAAVRTDEHPDRETLARLIKNRDRITVDLLFGDCEGGQRTISRFSLQPRGQDQAHWFCQSARHWNVDRPDPR